jgi:ABC-type multidrug transport system fused ATPase/permease subunit
LDPNAGAIERLAWQLRQLREKAGRPGYRHLAERAHYSAGTLADAARGKRLPSLEVTLAYTRACGGDESHWRALWLAAARASGDSPTEDQDSPPSCPYPGLFAFEPEDAQWYFGRDRMIERISGLIDQRPVVAVVGASGSGKSSLLRAGVIGAIRADADLARRWQVVLMTPTGSPVHALLD